MLGLIIAGEAVYALPFHVTRFFRPTVLEVFGLSNTELGTAQAVYGVVAMLAYFPGGPLADRYSARKLLALSLWTTAAGGLYMATLPGFRGAIIVWGFFGVTTILLFWAALIRATREWGGHDEQGRAYGLLDGGRGLLAAVLATLGAGLLTVLFPEGYEGAAFMDKKQALRLIIHGYSLVTALAGIFVWFVIRDGHPEDEPDLEHWRPGTETTWIHIRRVLAMPAVWLQALIVVCAYVGYKGFDNYALYAAQGWGMDDVEAARIAALAAWMRPVAAVGAGLLGDRFLVSRMTVVSFAVLLASDLLFALLTPAPGLVWLLTTNLLIGSAAVFGLRGLYFALFEEARVPAAVTGTAVGLVSVLGYTPDIFVSYVGGVLLDRSPGLSGHQDFFLFLAGFAALGLAGSSLLMRLLHGRRAN
jgi:nitrate/nitrite transporter NarK